MRVPRKRVWLIVVLCVVALGIACEGALLAMVHAASRRDFGAERGGGKRDVIIVLGARVMPGGELSTTLEHRIEAGCRAYEDGLASAFILCGARGGDEPETEAEAMRKYLTARGVPAEKIFLEDQSVNTVENLENAMAIMAREGMNDALLVTSDYHLTRALWIAGDVGLNAAGYAAPGPNLRRNQLVARLRETLSWANYWGRKTLGIG